MDDTFVAGRQRDVEIGYRGYTIHFNENQERWYCSALDIDAEKMSTIKAKIDKIVAASRKLTEEVEAIYVDFHNNATPVRIVAFAQPRGLTRGRPQAGDPTHAWVMMPGSERYYDKARGGYAYRQVEERKKVELDKLFADTPEVRDALREIERLRAAKDQLNKKIDEEREKMLLAKRAIDIPAPDPEQESD